MVAEQPRSLQTSVRMGSAASAGANPAVDTAMLQQWVQNVDANMVVIDGRLDALDYATVEMRGRWPTSTPPCTSPSSKPRAR